MACSPQTARDPSTLLGMTDKEERQAGQADDCRNQQRQIESERTAAATRNVDAQFLLNSAAH
jgi:hypothetical protein